jgi:hypothetical protein
MRTVEQGGKAMVSLLKLKGATAAAGALLLLASTQAVNAAPSISLDLATLDTFTILNDDPAGSVTTFDRTESTSFGTDFTDYTVDFQDLTQTAFAHVGASGLGLDWTAFDQFVINLRNQNENTGWEFSVVVEDGFGGSASSAVQILPVVPDTGPFSAFSVDITGLDRSDIDTVFFRVGGDLPLGTTDTTAEFAAQPIPMPATLALLGAGIIGLGVLGRRQSLLAKRSA